ncbi:homeobox protein OTX1 B-like [Enhydra lutris kenyoni]|uniref:Homeobox protein OTX1 B-like n=1 Tax=Enhydra lutris kenyoni TaxID=391180 RepID=A0A2Y9J2Z0_ENHLU|nr:homeobox protein OTX1 B-like [Enhydra lutris kenyoni]
MALSPASGEQPKMQSVDWEDGSLQPCPMGHQPQSTGFSGFPNKDGHNKVKETTGRRVNRKPRRKFTQDELCLLNHVFEETPYPDFIIRKKLAERLYCQIYAIDNWFQNRRARLPLKERQRISAARKLRAFPIQDHSHGSLQNSQAESPIGAPEQTCSSTLKALLEGTDYFSPETQWVPSQQDGSGDTGVPGIKKELSCASEYPGDTGNRLYPSYSSYSYGSAICLHPSASMQYFEKHEPNTGQSWNARASILPQVHSQQEEGWQQEQACCPYPLYQEAGQQPHVFAGALTARAIPAMSAWSTRRQPLGISSSFQR